MSNEWNLKLPVGMLAVALAGLLAASGANAQLHLWDFQGGPGNVLADKGTGGLDLGFAPGEGNVGGVMGGGQDVVFETGWNGYSLAYRPYYVDSAQSSTAGAGLTGSNFTSPNQFTIEAIVKADAKTSGSAVNYIFQTRPGSDRGYYLVQDEDNVGRTAIGGVGSIIGNNFGDAEIPGEYENDGTWIYVAAAIDLTSNAGQAVADIYAVELPASIGPGDPVPTPMLVADDRTWNTADPSALAGATGIFGIGNFAIDRGGDGVAEASQEWFQGAIDYVAIYDGLLTANELAGNLESRARAVPEPSTLALVGLAGVACLAIRRRLA